MKPTLRSVFHAILASNKPSLNDKEVCSSDLYVIPFVDGYKIMYSQKYTHFIEASSTEYLIRSGLIKLLLNGYMICTFKNVTNHYSNIRTGKNVTIENKIEFVYDNKLAVKSILKQDSKIRATNISLYGFVKNKQICTLVDIPVKTNFNHLIDEYTISDEYFHMFFKEFLK